MSIKIGDKVPSVGLKRLGKSGLEEVRTDKLFEGKKVVLFSVPGAYTPACSNEHLPGYVANAAAIKAKGVDEIICLAVNDPFVMKAWGEAHGATDKVTMLPDGNGEFTKALGLTQDVSAAGLGTRGKRFSMIVVNGKVTSLDVEPGKAVDVSSAGSCLLKL
jgi:peroxiredoxin